MVDRILEIPKNHSVFLFGPRQTGKSTLLRSVFKAGSTLFIDLLQANDYLRYSANPALFREEVMALGPEITHIVLDEVQRIPILLDEIHSIIEGPRPRIFILSGSSARKLKRSHANLLAGRAWTFHLFPLTSIELGERFSLSRALQYGALPAIYLDKDDVSAQRTLRAYVDTYLQEEIQIESNVRSIGTFFKFLNIAADISGTIVNFTAIAHDTGTSVNVIREFFRILEDTLIGSFLPAYTKSDIKRLIKHPKFLFFDVGVRNTLLGRQTSAFMEGTSDFGRAFEHFVILELMRMNAYREKSFRLYYYRTSNGSEVDVIIESPQGEVWAVEIKGSQDPALKSASGLLSFKEVVPHARLLCVCCAPRKRIAGDVLILPWRDLFKEIGFL